MVSMLRDEAEMDMLPGDVSQFLTGFGLGASRGDQSNKEAKALREALGGTLLSLQSCMMAARKRSSSRRSED